MIFEEGNIYHVYNRGNNKEKIFFNNYNYLYFIEKIRAFVLPYTDVLAWCLMPNHFHLMIKVNCVTFNNVSLNNSIGRMLSSYTRAINNQENRTGSLFQKHTQAVCLTAIEGITPAWYKTFGVTVINVNLPEKDYTTVCMEYIHYNPVKDGLVNKPEEWKFSLFREYIGLADSYLINIEKGMCYFNYS
ncbi:MAG: transposase [Bacteroidetes bacterium]|nr:transposase [Bacteroidota bacterium]